jgi:protein-histidine N-methyltransferase
MARRQTHAKCNHSTHDGTCTITHAHSHAVACMLRRSLRRDAPQAAAACSSGSVRAQVVCSIPQDIAITAVDAQSHPVVGPLAEGRGEISSLALWLLAERSSKTSEWAPLLDALPVQPC